MPAPTEFEIKTAEECIGGPWPDLNAITFKSPEPAPDTYGVE
jgi:hypothetical protein